MFALSSTACTIISLTPFFRLLFSLNTITFKRNHISLQNGKSSLSCHKMKEKYNKILLLNLSHTALFPAKAVGLRLAPNVLQREFSKC